MARAKWIKIVTDIFDDEKMVLIDSLPDHDSIIVIWFKLLCLAGKQNNGGVFLLGEKTPYTEEMLAKIIRRSPKILKKSLEIFKKFGMIEVVENTISIPNWDKHQSLDSYEKRKESDRLRQAKHRGEQRTESENMSRDSHVTSEKKSRDVTLTEEDKDIESNIITHYVRNNISSSDETGEEKALDEKKAKEEEYAQEVAEVVARLNQAAKVNYRPNSKKTRRHIVARLKEGYTVFDLCEVIEQKVEEWKGTEFEKYLRPETLFGSKFESYYNDPTQFRNIYKAWKAEGGDG